MQQPSYTDPINPIYNAVSTQPQDAGQFTWTRVFSPNVVNQLIGGGYYYSAIFSNADFAASTAASPFQAPLEFFDGDYSNMGGEQYAWPQGRRVSQYQVIDDLSWTKGNHALKFGVNFRGNRITDLTPFRNTSGLLEILSMTDFFNGTSAPGSSILNQRFEQTNEAGFQYYSLGLYAQDEWSATSKLRLTLSLRADRNSNESCPKGCFSRFAGSFQNLNHDVNAPYSDAIQTGLKQAFPSLQAIVFQPRVGFAYTARQDTVIRGGIGLFSDMYPGQIAERFVSNAPFVSSFNVTGGTLAPGVTGSLFTSAAASNAALLDGFANGGTLASIKAAVAAAGGVFSPPVMASAMNNTINPTYLQWNLELQHLFGANTAVTVNYVGNHGMNEFLVNPGLNTYCAKIACAGGPVVITNPNPPPATIPAVNPGNSGFISILPATDPDARFGNINQITNSGNSNYNGLTFSLQQHVTRGFSGQLSYTYSHSLDDNSNAGLQPYSTNQTSDSLLPQINPFTLRGLNYGNSDYDFRHNFSATYIWELPFKSTNAYTNAAIGGWIISGIVHFRSGQPYSVINSSTPGAVLSNGSQNIVLGTFLGNATGSVCGHPSFDPNNPNQCLSASQFDSSFPSSSTTFTGAGNGYGNLERNQFRGPDYFDTDLSVYKNFTIKERLTFTLGMNAFNILNHPNFANPNGNVNSGTFGVIQSTVAAASSPYGNFQSSAASGRILQTVLKLVF